MAKVDRNNRKRYGTKGIESKIRNYKGNTICSVFFAAYLKAV